MISQKYTLPEMAQHAHDHGYQILNLVTVPIVVPETAIQGAVVTAVLGYTAQSNVQRKSLPIDTSARVA